MIEAALIPSRLFGFLKAHSIGRRAVIVFCAAASIAMARGQMGIYEPAACRYLAALLLAAAFGTGMSSFRKGRLAGVLALVVLAIFVFERRSSQILLIVPLVFGAVAGELPVTFLALAGASLLYEVLDLCRVNAAVSLDACAAVSSCLSGGRLVLGPTPMGAHLWIYGLSLALAAALTPKPRAAWILGLLAGLVALLVLQVHVQSPWFLAAGIAVLFAFVLREEIVEAAPPRCGRLALAGPGVLALAAGGFLVAYPAEGERAVGKILISSTGLFSLEEPVHGVYGKELTHGPYLSLLVRFLKAAGLETETFGAALSDEALKKCRVLVVVNPTRAFPAEEVRAVDAFVRRGGSLLLVGEHTTVEGVRVHSNALLASSGIELNDDSAVPWGRPSYSLEWMSHPTTWFARGDDDFQLGVGCSLTVRAPARPLLVGRTAFSDAADPSNAAMAFLGNMKRDDGERTGDIVLAAESALGKGKVVVFGDSLTFQNGLIPRAWPFVLRLFDDLMRAREPRATRLGLALALIGVLAVLSLRDPRGIGAASAILCVVLAAVEFKRSSLSREPVRQLRLQGPVAFIDWTHGPVTCKIGGDDPDSIEGLVLNLARNGFLPLCRTEEVGLDQARMLILPASARAYRLTDDLLDFMRRGGFVIATVGESEAGCIEEFSRWAGLGLFHKALGPGGNIRTVEKDLKVKFYSAWPIVAEREDLLPLVLAWDYPVIELKPVGSGGFILVGDSSFFASKNLESYDTITKENIEFFKYLCGLVSGKR